MLPEALHTKCAGFWTRESPRVNPEQDPTPQQADTGRKELWAALACSGAVPTWGNSPAARKNEDASHLQDLVAEGSVSNHFLAAPALKASPGNPPLQSQMVLLSPTEHVGTQDAPHPTKHRASLTLEILVALGCKYTNTREDALHGVFNPGGARWHSHVSHISFTLSPESRVISNSTGRRRDGGSSMEREKPAGVRRCRDEGSAAGGTQRALVPGLRALGTRTHMARAGPGPAPVPCPRPAPGHPRTLQGPATHWQNSERKRRKKKAGKWPQPPLPSQRYSQQHTLSTGISPCTSTSLGR